MSTTRTRPALIVRTFMTHEMRDEDIAALSTGREEEFRRIMAAIERSLEASPGPLQHIVLYGSRGFGKSFMTRRVQIAVGDIERTKDLLLYVLLPEEQHNLQRSPHAFLDAIRQSLTGIERPDDKAFEEGHFQWPRPGEEARRWNEASERLERAIDQALGGRKGLVVAAVENFDTLLATLFKVDEDEQRLRLWLDRPRNRLMLLTTATGTVDIDYERPLFKAFEPVHLSPWSADDCISYFNRLRAREGRDSLTSAQEAKARAIAEFIGGTPRLAQLLAEVIDTQDALTVAETMSALADKLAEYYRRRIEDLPPLARGLLDALIRGGEPASQTQLADRVGARGQSDIARVMSDLQRADAIRGQRSPDSRETLYAVTDRVFVHYYRLRQGSRIARATPLATILDFLRSFYSPDEKREQVLAYLQAGRPAEASLFSSLALDGETPAGGHYAQGFEVRWATYMRSLPAEKKRMSEIAAKLRDDPACAFDLCTKFKPSTPLRVMLISIAQAQAVFRLGAADRAEAILQKAASFAQAPLLRLLIAMELSDFSMYVRDDWHQAAETAAAASEAALNPEVPDRIRLRGLADAVWALASLERRKHAMEILEPAIDLAVRLKDRKSQLYLLKYKMLVGGLMRQYDQVLQAAPTATELAKRLKQREDQAIVAWQRALALRATGDISGAVSFADEAITLSKEVVSPNITMGALHEKGSALSAKGEHAEAKQVFQEGVDLALSASDEEARATFLSLLSYSLNGVHSYDEAEKAARSSISLAQKVGDNQTETTALVNLLAALTMRGDFEDAVEVFATILARNSPEAFVAGSSIATVIGAHLPRPDIISAYAQSIDVASKFSGVLKGFNPWRFLNNAFGAAARANNFEALDAALEAHREWVAQATEAIVFSEDEGAVISRIGATEGRAAAFAAAANLLPRIASLMSDLQPETRDQGWLPKFVNGFAASCRDAGLLRDVASLLTEELGPNAEFGAQLLLSLAKVDEAPEAERALARLDPDIATLLRRIRELPDPAPASKRRAGNQK